MPRAWLCSPNKASNVRTPKDHPALSGKGQGAERADLPVLGRVGQPALTGNAQGLAHTIPNTLAVSSQVQPALTGKGQGVNPPEKVVVTTKSPALTGKGLFVKGPREQVAGFKEGGASYASIVTGG